jgi:hypothetical protein
LISLNVTPVGGTAATLSSASVANNSGVNVLTYIVVEAGERVTISSPVTGPTVQVAGIQFDA